VKRKVPSKSVKKSGDPDRGTVAPPIQEDRVRSTTRPVTVISWAHPDSGIVAATKTPMANMHERFGDIYLRRL